MFLHPTAIFLRLAELLHNSMETKFACMSGRGLRRRPVLGSNLLCYVKFENMQFDSIDLLWHGSSEVIWLSNSAVCKFHHDLYEVNAF